MFREPRFEMCLQFIESEGNERLPVAGSLLALEAFPDSAGHRPRNPKKRVLSSESFVLSRSGHTPFAVTNPIIGFDFIRFRPIVFYPFPCIGKPSCFVLFARLAVCFRH